MQLMFLLNNEVTVTYIIVKRSGVANKIDGYWGKMNKNMTKKKEGEKTETKYEQRYCNNKKKEGKRRHIPD